MGLWLVCSPQTSASDGISAYVTLEKMVDVYCQKILTSVENLCYLSHDLYERVSVTVVVEVLSHTQSHLVTC